MKGLPGAGPFDDVDAVPGIIARPQEVKNPKDILGSTRINLGNLSPAAMVEEALAMEEGGLKYGFNNMRSYGVQCMIYLGAALRHIWKFIMGEDRDPVTGVHHLGYARACLGIVLDAAAYGKLHDDRPPRLNGFSKVMDAMEARVKHLRELFKDKSPKHYTIADSEDPK